MIPGFIITWLTFPGVIIHELAHQLFCKWTRTQVLEVCYFRFGNPAGYVIHEHPDSIWKHLLIGFGPLFINTVFGFLIGLGALAIKATLGEGFFFYVSMWLAISVAMHSFPSTGDAKSMWGSLWGPHSSIPARIVGTPLVILIFVGAIGSVFWLDLIYGVGVVIGIPALLHLA